MSIVNKPDYKVFAQDAKSGEIETFPDVLRGWGVTLDRTAGKPPLEWFNAIGKRVDEWLMYLSQRGLAEWDSTVDYPQYAAVQHSGKFYVALKQNISQQPDRSQNNWQSMADFLGAPKLVLDALNTKQDKGDYATNAQLNTVSSELNKSINAANTSATNANNNANTRLSKSQNGADIPNKSEFIKNLGLVETVNKANNAVSSISGGTIKAGLNVQSVLSVGISQNKNLRISSNETADSQINLIVWGNSNRKTIFECGDKNGCLFYSHRLSSNNVELFSTGKIIPSDYSNFDARYDNVPAGVPMPYPHRYTPPGYLTCNGQTFDKSLYPKLAEAYPAGRVPDLRGEFIRGWDDSRGVDPGRVCGTWQADCIPDHNHYKVASKQLVEDLVLTGDAGWYTSSGSSTRTRSLDQNTYTGGVTEAQVIANETRPRNIAFNYIVRAV
ncbi:phage tail protein [Photorhabdus laumondii]|uniref:Photorhabdus luminescens subsp. laumondii TTO1 complete genome segment 10/17 n=1 Tax=Photorhabdus laumondii subsp. laumondii (strain DSM 15139 / CIP 105565 / TT01) TaxID=243265 RepID=Q7N348_PHOLL|nr:phage tail protein [Photorhabdus laumondii]AXG47910.1 phage tail protein [Photorhabdus laumondii subsp. laumondii]CAE15248.1 unnamed protein product [Photorhabdus laumondii subsp. laumondii TTO1]